MDLVIVWNNELRCWIKVARLALFAVRQIEFITTYVFILFNAYSGVGFFFFFFFSGIDSAMYRGRCFGPL